MEGAELRVGVLVADASLERSHGLLGRHGFGPDDVGDFEVEGDVLPGIALGGKQGKRERGAYKLLLVALSICSSRAELAEDDHQLIILTVTTTRQGSGGEGRRAGYRGRRARDDGIGESRDQG